MNELKPCPFCGGTSLIMTGREIYLELFYEKVFKSVSKEYQSERIAFEISCTQCDTDSWTYETLASYEVARKKAIEKWNKRYECEPGRISSEFGDGTEEKDSEEENAGINSDGLLVRHEGETEQTETRFETCVISAERL